MVWHIEQMDHRDKDSGPNLFFVWVNYICMFWCLYVYLKLPLSLGRRQRFAILLASYSFIVSITVCMMVRTQSSLFFFFYPVYLSTLLSD